MSSLSLLTKRKSVWFDIAIAGSCVQNVSRRKRDASLFGAVLLAYFKSVSLGIDLMKYS